MVDTFSVGSPTSQSSVLSGEDKTSQNLLLAEFNRQFVLHKHLEKSVSRERKHEKRQDETLRKVENTSDRERKRTKRQDDTFKKAENARDRERKREKRQDGTFKF